ncbi:polymerase/histidinol phosphatase-like protein [Lipomyces doorenjongii]
MQSSPILRSGTVTPTDQLTQKLVAFDVPAGTTSIHVKYSYTGREGGNAIDLGLLGVNKQFRGYSGGSKFDVTVANDEATPGYVAGLLAPGEWYVLLGVYHITSSSASYHVEITLDDSPRPVFEATPAPARVDFSSAIKRLPGQRPVYKWLKGDFHMHTQYSDGKFTLDELVDKALKRGLDFIFSTEHNTFSANLAWGQHVPKGFLVGRGIEVTTFGGHWNAIGLLPHQFIDPRICDMKDMDASLVAAVEEVHKSDGFAILNHPFAECKCCEWTYSFHDHMDAIEVWNGPWRRHPEDESNVKAVEKWDSLLREGKIFTASGGSDIHEPQFEIAEPLTRVLANETSVNAIIQGLRARHVYLTQHPAYEIEFFLRQGSDRAGIGDWLETTEEVIACVMVKGFPECELRLITEKGIVHKTSQTKLNFSIKAHYVRVEVRNAQDNMLALTNPIWIL